MRPAIYGAYHHITVLGKENEPCDHKYDVTGSLCENCDKFAIDRFLPEIEMGDYLLIYYSYYLPFRHITHNLKQSYCYTLNRESKEKSPTIIK